MPMENLSRVRNRSELKLVAGVSPADVQTMMVLQCWGEIFFSEGQVELVAFALSGRGACMSECEERVRIPLGKSSCNTTCHTEVCKGFLRKKTGGIFSSVNQG